MLFQMSMLLNVDIVPRFIISGVSLINSGKNNNDTINDAIQEIYVGALVTLQ